MKRHSGPNVAINSGLNQSAGEFVAIIACDDWVHEDFFSCSIETLEQHEEAAFCFSDPAARKLGSPSPKYFHFGISDVSIFLKPDDLIELWSRIYFSFPTNTVIFRTKLLLNAGSFEPDLEIYADWYICHILAMQFGACYVPKNLTLLHVSKNTYSGSYSRSLQKKSAAFARVLKKICDEQNSIAVSFSRNRILPTYDLRLINIVNDNPIFATWSVRRSIALRHCWNCVRGLVPHKSRNLARYIIYRRWRCFYNFLKAP